MYAAFLLLALLAAERNVAVEHRTCGGSTECGAFACAPAKTSATLNVDAAMTESEKVPCSAWAIAEQHLTHEVDNLNGHLRHSGNDGSAVCEVAAAHGACHTREAPRSTWGICRLGSSGGLRGRMDEPLAQTRV